MRFDTVPDEPETSFSDAAWVDVIEAMDRTYGELVLYQEKLETQNTELDEMRQFMASVLESVSDVLLVLDRENRIEQTGGSATRLFEKGADALMGAEIATLACEDSRPPLLEALERVIRTRARVTLEIVALTPAGRAPLELSIAPRLNERGRSLGAVVVGRPVGELRRAYSELANSHAALKEAQAHLVRNEKLASLGRLVAGVAHELNNPISFVYANTHALEKYATRFEAYFDAVQSGASRSELIALREELRLDRVMSNLRTAIDGARDGAERVRDIVEDLRRLSAEGSSEAVEFDFVTTSRTAADWVVRGTKTPVKVRIEEGPRPAARGNPGHVQQIVMNLVQNAIDALAQTEGAEVVLTHAVEGETAVLRVQDNGPGIAAENRAAVFDPFFTTKAVGEGTGLGLSISHKMAQEHGGELRLCDTEHHTQGTVFELRLPKGKAG